MKYTVALLAVVALAGCAATAEQLEATRTGLAQGSALAKALVGPTYAPLIDGVQALASGVVAWWAGSKVVKKVKNSPEGKILA